MKKKKNTSRASTGRKKTATKTSKKTAAKKGTSRKTSRQAGPAKKSPSKKRAKKPVPLSELDSGEWTLRLYVAGDSPKSVSARENLKRLCDKHLPGKCTIEVVDLVEHPELARADQILAIPTLVRKIPVPIKRIIGDLSNEERSMLALDVHAE